MGGDTALDGRAEAEAELEEAEAELEEAEEEEELTDTDSSMNGGDVEITGWATDGKSGRWTLGVVNACLMASSRSTISTAASASTCCHGSGRLLRVCGPFDQSTLA